MKIKNVIAEQISGFVCCFPLNILIVILLFRFFIQTVKYIIAIIKKERRSEEMNDDWNWEGALLLIKYFVLTTLWLYSESVFALQKILLLIYIVFMSLNTVIDFLLYAWLWRAKGKKFVLYCTLVLISVFYMYSILVIHII